MPSNPSPLAVALSLAKESLARDALSAIVSSAPAWIFSLAKVRPADSVDPIPPTKALTP